MDFRWNAWNIDYLGRHGVTREAAEEVVQAARSPYPRKVGEDKLLVWGASEQGELLQVVFVLDEDGSIFVIHARPLTAREKRRYRRHAS